MESSCITRLSRSSNFHKVKRPENKILYSDLLMKSLPPPMQLTRNLQFAIATYATGNPYYCVYLNLQVTLSVLARVATELIDRDDIPLLLEGI